MSFPREDHFFVEGKAVSERMEDCSKALDQVRVQFPELGFFLLAMMPATGECLCLHSGPKEVLVCANQNAASEFLKGRYDK